MTTSGTRKRKIDEEQPESPESNSQRLENFQGFLMAYVQSRLPQGLRRNLGVSDVVQSVFCAAGQHKKDFGGSSENQFRGWLKAIAERKIIDGLRRHRKRNCPPRRREAEEFGWTEQQAEPIPLDNRTPSRQISVTEEARLLLEAIEQLPGEIQRIVTLRHVGQLTFEQIAAEVQLPVTTCRRRWLEGLQILSGKLATILR